MATLTIFDETTAGQRTEALRVSLSDPTISVRELIRTRIFEEVGKYNERAVGGPYCGLVQPADSEVAVNGQRVRSGRLLDWRQQVEVALKAFEGNGFLVLVDDRQVESLEEQIRVRDDTQVTFLKLVPLVGG